MALQDIDTLAAEGHEVAQAGTDLVELYYERGWTDGFPVVPPTPAKIEAMIVALGGDADVRRRRGCRRAGAR